MWHESFFYLTFGFFSKYAGTFLKITKMTNQSKFGSVTAQTVLLQIEWHLVLIHWTYSLQVLLLSRLETTIFKINSNFFFSKWSFSVLLLNPFSSWAYHEFIFRIRSTRLLGEILNTSRGYWLMVWRVFTGLYSLTSSQSHEDPSLCWTCYSQYFK